MLPEVTDPDDGLHSQSPMHVTEIEEYVPGAHALQLVDPATAYVPAVQRMQALAPEPAAYEPAGQVLQPDNAVDQIALNPEKGWSSGNGKSHQSEVSTTSKYPV